jgi:hypothetical protein
MRMSLFVYVYQTYGWISPIFVQLTNKQLLVCALWQICILPKEAIHHGYEISDRRHCQDEAKIKIGYKYCLWMEFPIYKITGKLSVAYVI